MGQKLHRAATKSRKKFRLDKWFPYMDKKFAGMALGHGFALWEHLVRVPLIITGPGIAPVRVEDQVRHIDLFPTLADLCGVTVPGDIDGRSVRPLIDGATLPDEPAYMEAVGVKLEGDRITAVRTPDWKLMRFKGGKHKDALFRLNSGSAPDEKHNVLTRHPEVASMLAVYMERVLATESEADSPLSESDEAVIEQHLRDLGYL